MIPHPFEYYAPTEIGEALGLLGAHGPDASVLGGGTWLVPEMSHGIRAPKVVVDARLLDLRGVGEDEHDVTVGACATYETLKSSAVIARHGFLLARMADEITGGPQITGQGTIGGAACYANPASDVPAVLVALEARMRLRSTAGDREVDASAFFTGAFETSRRADELLTEIVFPKLSSNTTVGYQKLKFSAGSWPIVTAACLARTVDGARRLRIAIGGACPAPASFELSASTSDRDLDAEVASRASDMVVDEWSDELAGPGYRRSVAGAIAARAARQCLGMAVP